MRFLFKDNVFWCFKHVFVAKSLFLVSLIPQALCFQPSPITKDVPQGSVLGVLLFIFSFLVILSANLAFSFTAMLMTTSSICLA